MKNLLITTALPYANGNLHIGHMLGYIKADIWVRYKRMIGDNCIFICGSDTHGTPIMIKSKKLNIKPTSLIEKYQKQHLLDLKKCEIIFDHYQSTHNIINYSMVKKIFIILKNNNLIEKINIQQAYDKKEKMFLPDRYIIGMCPKCLSPNQYGDNCDNCGSVYNIQDLINPFSILSKEKPIYKTSDHFFFKLSKCKKIIKTWIKKNEHNFQEDILLKIQEWMSMELKDWDISRDHPYFGFPIPHTNSKKYFYVWFDAPIGYLAAFKYYCCNNNYNKLYSLWNNKKNKIYHFIGKDIMYFHFLFWPAILQTIGLKNPDNIFVNGFVNINNEKMSKSKNINISMKNYSKYFPTYHLRYFFASKLNNKINDINLNLDDFINKTNIDLIGKIINIASRNAIFINNYFNNKLSNNIIDENLYNKICNISDEIKSCYNKQNYSKIIRIILEISDNINMFTNNHKPWELIKNIKNKNLVHDITSQAIIMFKMIIGYLKPIIPSISIEAENFLKIKINSWEDITKKLHNHSINKYQSIITRIKKEKINFIINN